MALITLLIAKGKAFCDYFMNGVWTDTRNTLWIRITKTLSLTVNSFLNSDIQSQACAMTYRTMLAIVPALALLFAIGRGFGFQKLLQDELYQIFPSQREAISHALAFVDSYLNQASEGIFVGIGVVFLLYTIINLMSNVESAFNHIWNVRQGRAFWRKITDYTAMLLILPVLMICGGGLAMFVSNAVESHFELNFMTPVVRIAFELGYFVFTCLFFAAALMMIPNTKVRFPNALMAGTFTGIGFSVLQWLFVTGQVYVSKYNAIYGTFSFLPLMLIWLQLVWVIFLSGSLICYASQNTIQFSFSNQIARIADSYKIEVSIAIATIVVQRFLRQEPPVQQPEIVTMYNIPSRLVSTILDDLSDAGVVSKVEIDEKHQIFGYQPGAPTSMITIDFVCQSLDKNGYSDFIPGFEQNLPGVVNTMDQIWSDLSTISSKTLLSDLTIKAPSAP